MIDLAYKKRRLFSRLIILPHLTILKITMRMGFSESDINIDEKVLLKEFHNYVEKHNLFRELWDLLQEYDKDFLYSKNPFRGAQ